MRTIRVHVSTIKVGSAVETDIEVEDDATNDDIDAIASQAMLEQLINWTWSEVAPGEKE